MAVPNSQNSFLGDIQETLRHYDTQLKDINQKIWSNPELAFKEYLAHDFICELFDGLASSGYQVQRKAFGVDTALEVNYSYGTGGRTVAFNAEYDALPGIGHACGHNLIATTSIAAFIATCETMKAHAQSSGVSGFTVRLLGTPAEESGGGKVKLIDAGAYEGVDACLMIHPVPIFPELSEILTIAAVAEGGYLANHKVKATFIGKPAHAAAAPWEGINALDAVVSAYVNISLLRQQILPSQKVHGIIVNGGDRPNIIPMSATIDYYIRSPTRKSLKVLTDKVINCFEAAATATGCKLELEWGVSYDDMKSNNPLCERYLSAIRNMGHRALFDNSQQKRSLFSGGSTDMGTFDSFDDLRKFVSQLLGNVSYVVPGFHGLFCIPVDGVNHTPEFTQGAGSQEGFERGIACAAGMAEVACQVLVDDKFAEAVKKDFQSE
ncbi:hypothetical protein N7457_004989 [Penicillium paradoxum]|uniref:uncharacterized protein n=1 Tax=Penicillium paradoxum TaxID=176176 RepID=UPI00254784DA|nr:uncharacterized protein N7457_004989 [Penicillium paradoxum]KAJ5783215.1 hypothetical protein N7457_004989 [Penicillium paradoxum]